MTYDELLVREGSVRRLCEAYWEGRLTLEEQVVLERHLSSDETVDSLVGMLFFIVGVRR